MGRWTRKQVEQFAPDEKSVKAALKLARPGPWSETGSTDTLLWGKCQGSGAAAYQVSVDLTGPAAKCTCPSRKFPCKHGVALLLMWVEGDGSIADAAEAADFAGDWAAGRAEKTAQKESRAEAASAAAADPEAQAKRLEKRLTLMSAGVADFEIWLADLYRHGFAQAKQQPYAFWDDAAARLLDSQLPGLANRVRAMPEMLSTRTDWADHLLLETGRWFTALRAWQRRDLLGTDDMGNLRAFLGWATSTDEVRKGTPLSDTWMVEGVHRTDDGRILAQRTWVRGNVSGERFLMLDFAAVGAALGVAHVVGSLITTPLVTYPGSGVRRGLFVDTPTTAESAFSLPAPCAIDDALDLAAAQISANPFADQVPVSVQASVLVDDQAAYVVDSAGAALPLADGTDPWLIMALIAHSTVPMFGELEDGHFRPLTIELVGELVPV